MYVAWGDGPVCGKGRVHSQNPTSRTFKGTNFNDYIHSHHCPILPQPDLTPHGKATGEPLLTWLSVRSLSPGVFKIQL